VVIQTLFARLAAKHQKKKTHLGPAVLVEVEAGLLHLADLREQLLRVANSEWRLGEGIRCQGPFVESIRVGEAA
jgi:hypothetical protein|tara:strand:+ start:167 stop:388 length:222 start_codon:yes stop_codon:yes gene_type:complete